MPNLIQARIALLLFVSLSLSLLIPANLSAFHIIGGEITYTCLGNNQYRINLNVYRDCAGEGADFDNPAFLHIYDGNGNQVTSPLEEFAGNQGNIQPNEDICVETFPTEVCVQSASYEYLWSAPTNVTYPVTIAYQRYSRNITLQNIINPGETGSTYTTTIPASDPCNNAPSFEEFPPVVVCAESDIYFDHGAFDLDGDSLVYELCTPLIGGDADCFQPGACGGTYDSSPPYDEVIYTGGFGPTNPLPANPPLAIDPFTGLLTGKPTQLGQYVVAVCVTEYRNGVAINTISRDFQFNVSECTVVSAILGDDVSLCAGSDYQLNGNLIGANDFFWTPADQVSNPNILNPTVSESGTYSLTAVNDQGCQDVENIVVEILPPVQVELEDDITICRGEEYQLDDSGISGATGISWSPGFGLDDNTAFDPITFAPYTIEYIATGFNDVGCTDKDTLVVNVLLVPEANAGEDVSICKGDSVLLSGGGGEVIDWFPTSTLSDPFQGQTWAKPTVTTTYTLTIGDVVSNCIDTDQVTVTVLNSDVAVGGDAQICDDETVQLSVFGGSTFEWTPAETLSAGDVPDPIASPSETTSYNVKVTDDNGCVLEEEVTVFVSSSPALTAGENQQICQGGSTPISAEGEGTFSWIPPNTLENAQSSSPTASPAVSTTYYVTLTNESGCSTVDSVRVEVLPPAGFVESNQVIICADEDGQLQAGGGVSYSWAPTTGLSDPNIANPIATPDQTTIYTVTIVDEVGCSIDQTVSVFRFSDNLISAGGDVTICSGESTELLASGGNSFSWNPDPTLSATDISNPIATPTETTTYTVFIDSGEGCSGESSVTVTVEEAPQIDAGEDINICNGGSAIVAASGEGNITWSPALGISNTTIINPVVSPAETTTYTLVVSSDNGCESTDEMIVTVAGEIDPEAGDDAFICLGETATLQASGGNSYSWTPSAGLSDDSIANPEASPDATTTYYVTIANDDCAALDSVTVFVQGELVADAGQDASVCTGESVTLSGTGGTEYSWSPNTGLSDANVQNPVATPPFTITYTLTTSSGDCQSQDQVTITVSDELTANAGPDVNIEEGETAQLNASGGTTYEWTPTEGLSDANIANPIASPTESTTYFLTVSSGECSDTDFMNVFVGDDPGNTVSAEAGLDVTICEGESVLLSGSGTSGADFTWTPAIGLDNTDVPNPIASPPQTTTYTLSVTTENGTATDEVTVTVVNQLVASVSEDGSICGGEAIQLEASGGATYSWEPATGLSNPTIANPLASPDITTEYTVTVSSGECEDQATVEIVVFPGVSLVAGEDQEICEGEEVQLTVSSSESVEWSPAAGLSATDIVDPIAAPTEPTTYYVTSFNESCVAVDSVFVNVKTQLTAEAGEDVTICGDGSAELNGDGGEFYFWSPAFGLSAINEPDPIASPTITTTYYLSAFGTNACESIDSVTVFVAENLVAEAGPNAVVCGGGSANLLASGGQAYAWSPAEGLSATDQSDPVAEPLETTTYYVTVSSGECAAVDSVTVFVATEIVANAGPDESICPGQAIQLSGSGGSEYSWTPSEGLSNPNVPGPVASPEETTTYYLTVTSGECTATDSTTVFVENTVTAEAGDGYTICSGEVVQLNGSGEGEYLWTPNVGLSDVTIPNPSATVSESTWYYLFVTSGGCTDVDSVFVEVSGDFTGDAGPNIQSCPGNSVELDASGGTSYFWYPNVALTNNSIPNPVASPSETTTYYCDISGPGDCLVTDSMTVFVFDESTVTISEDVVLCSGDFTQLSATGGFNYFWTPSTGLSDNTVANPLAIPTETTTYVVTIVSEFGCQLTQSVTVNIFDSQLVDAGNDMTICEGDDIELMAFGGTNFLWSPAATLSDPQIANPVANPTETTTYEVVAGSGTECSASSTVTIFVESQPSLDAGEDQSICIGDSVQLQAVGDGVMYRWDEELSLDNYQIPDPMATPEETTTYYITLDPLGCSARDSVTVTVFENTEADGGLDAVMCQGQPASFAASGGDTYLWSPDTGLSSTSVADPTVLVDQDTEYTVAITDENGCVVVDTVSAVVFNNQTVNAGEDQYICTGTSVQLFASGGGTFAWTPAATLDASDVFNPIATPTETTTYEVTVGGGTECSGSDSVTVFVTDNLSEPGVMSSDTVVLCHNEVIQLSANNPVFGENEVPAFVLHTGSTTELGTVLAMNNTGVFSLDMADALQTNEVYSVTPVVGPGDDLPDLDNDCLKVGKGSPILFLDPLEMNMNEICSGEEILIVSVVIGGYGAFDQESIYEVNGSWIGEVEFGVGFTTIFSQAPDNSYSFTVTDARGCQATFESEELPNCDVVPIELLTFGGEVLPRYNLLSWQTAAEIDVEQFHLQRSFDGQNFETLAKLEAVGIDNQESGYQFADEDIRWGTSYYRLLEESSDGELTICSQVIVLDRKDNAGFELLDLVPSISSDDEIQVLIQVEQAGTLDIAVFDYTGRLVQKSQTDSEIGTQSFPLDISRLPAGAYLVQVSDANNRAVKKLIRM